MVNWGFHIVFRRVLRDPHVQIMANAQEVLIVRHQAGSPLAPSPEGGQICFVELTGPDHQADALLEAHFTQMRAQTPAESCHVMTADELRAAGARVFVGRDAAGEVVAIGAIKPLDATAAELKSMHCHVARRGQGLGRALLSHLLDQAGCAGFASLWLETGSGAEFAAARALYRSAGFTGCAPFGDYSADPLSVFMMRPL